MSCSSVAISVKKLRPQAQLPHFATPQSAGADLYACLDESITIEVGCRVLIPTGLALQLPTGFEAQVRARSGLALHYGIGVLNSPGTIDSDYRGEVGVLLINLGDEPFVVAQGDRIAQLVISRCEGATFTLVQSLDESERGSGGFGSTGV